MELYNTMPYHLGQIALLKKFAINNAIGKIRHP